MKIKRNLKKIASLLLAVVMVFAMTVITFADGENGQNTSPEGSSGTSTVTTHKSGTFENTKGSITIKNISKDVTYKIYRIFKLNSFNTAEQAYSYSINEGWEDFLTQTRTREH